MKSGLPRCVFDATPLIHLAKISLLEEALEACEAFITESVEKETTENTEYPDVLLIRDHIERGLLKVHSPKNKAKIAALARHPEIHPGEAETLISAEELEACAMIDDQEARVVAKIYQISTHPGTLYILLRLVAMGRLRPSEAEEKLDQMISAGLHLDMRTYLAVKRKLRENQTNQK